MLQKTQIIHGGKEVDQTPLVAIKCLTYNHEQYIKDALEGFVMQKTTFPFVAIVHDDASTDGTAAIIREYAEKYPDIIKPIYESENLYSKRDSTLGQVVNTAVLASGAKYVALCEGDDYWTDPLKLQKQVDFLESHPDYSLVFANARLHYDTGLSEDTFPLENRRYDALELYSKGLVPTPTIIYRKEVLFSECFQKLSQLKKAVFGDLTLYMAATTIGDVFGMGDVVCGYRRMSTGQTRFLVTHRYSHFRNRIAISNYLGMAFKKIDRDKFSLSILPAIKTLHCNFYENVAFILRFFWFAPSQCVKEILKIPWIFLKKMNLLLYTSNKKFHVN